MSHTKIPPVSTMWTAPPFLNKKHVWGLTTKLWYVFPASNTSRLIMRLYCNCFLTPREITVAQLDPWLAVPHAPHRVLSSTSPVRLSRSWKPPNIQRVPRRGNIFWFRSVVPCEFALVVSHLRDRLLSSPKSHYRTLSHAEKQKRPPFRYTHVGRMSSSTRFSTATWSPMANMDAHRSARKLLANWFLQNTFGLRCIVPRPDPNLTRIVWDRVYRQWSCRCSKDLCNPSVNEIRALKKVLRAWPVPIVFVHWVANQRRVWHDIDALVWHTKCKLQAPKKYEKAMVMRGAPLEKANGVRRSNLHRVTELLCTTVSGQKKIDLVLRTRKQFFRNYCVCEEELPARSPAAWSHIARERGELVQVQDIDGRVSCSILQLLWTMYGMRDPAWPFVLPFSHCKISVQIIACFVVSFTVSVQTVDNSCRTESREYKDVLSHSTSKPTAAPENAWPLEEAKRIQTHPSSENTILGLSTLSLEGHDTSDASTCRGRPFSLALFGCVTCQSLGKTFSRSRHDLVGLSFTNLAAHGQMFVVTIRLLQPKPLAMSPTHEQSLDPTWSWNLLFSIGSRRAWLCGLVTPPLGAAVQSMQLHTSQNWSSTSRRWSLGTVVSVPQRDRCLFADPQSHRATIRDNAVATSSLNMKLGAGSRGQSPQTQTFAVISRTDLLHKVFSQQHGRPEEVQLCVHHTVSKVQVKSVPTFLDKICTPPGLKPPAWRSSQVCPLR